MGMPKKCNVGHCRGITDDFKSNYLDTAEYSFIWNGIDRCFKYKIYNN